ncbi:unnamed protein product [Vitrella brassicaformis CCMP3155]|uniref:Uncharacterized protein n=1 Tax=Vitrella brassicaformis (strain CCMP3155) TaxID=1169540 RepID=A0A0G4EAJ0_VITBC|nr:unnamed protein product [Vitrella brassicaformis CCMP3155]|eukprot:CEL92264.1 unnamed protein product [Vitrella brassicaformis CCMP3155]
MHTGSILLMLAATAAPVAQIMAGDAAEEGKPRFVLTMKGTRAFGETTQLKLLRDLRKVLNDLEGLLHSQKNRVNLKDNVDGTPSRQGNDTLPEQVPCPGGRRTISGDRQVDEGFGEIFSFYFDSADVADFFVVALDSTGVGNSDLSVTDYFTGTEVLSENESDGEVDTFEDVVIVDTSQIDGSYGLDIVAFCVEGPCEYQLVVFEHTGECVPSPAIDIEGVDVGISDTLPVLAPPTP